MDRPAVNVTKQRVENVARQFRARHHVKIAVVRLDIGKALEPFGLLQPSGFLALNFLDDSRSLIWERFGRLNFLRHQLHAFGDQFIAQPRHDLGAIVLGNPVQERAAVNVLAVPMIAAERAVQRLVARLYVAVRMRLMVRADNPAPALIIDTRDDQRLV